MPTVIRKNEASSPALYVTRREVLHAVGWHVHVGSTVWSPPTDLYETGTAYVVRVEIAGMREEDIEVILANNYLTISGLRPDVPERRAYHQMEIRFGKFITTIGLPGAVDDDAAQAEYRDGFLTVILPKAE